MPELLWNLLPADIFRPRVRTETLDDETDADVRDSARRDECWLRGICPDTETRNFSTEQSSGPGAQSKLDEPVAQVQIIPIERKTIAEKLTCYGSVVAQPGKTHFVAISFESRIQHILVTAGQLVSAGDALLEIAGSSATLLQFHQAETAAQTGRKELEQAKQRYNLKLATNQELGQAQKAASDTELQLKSLQNEGISSASQIRSDITGLVAKVNVEEGQIAIAGSPLVELVATGDIDVKLGVDPEDIPRLQPGQSVGISLVNNPATAQTQGAIRLITQRVNPADRLVDVFVSIPSGTRLLLGGYVQGEITVAARETLVVPRDAVLPEDGSYALYVVQNDHAVRKRVKIGLQTAFEVEIIESDLHEGEQIVTIGNHELTDGMAVKAQESK